MKKICQHCNQTFIQRCGGDIKHCSRKCYSMSRAPKPLSCNGCGKKFTPACSEGWKDRKFCSRECYRKRAGIKMLLCTGCHKSFVPKDSRYSTHCSRECFFEMKKQRSEMYQSAEAMSASVGALLSWHHPPCKYCGKEMRGRPNHKKYCSSLCTTRSNSANCAHVVVCRCGNVASIAANIKSPGGRKRLCFMCDTASKKLRKKAERKARKARIRGASRSESFSSDDVFRRDKWRCQDCGAKVTRNVPVNHDRYPNLDHIVPVSRGGDHTMANTQCLCRKCNIKKSDKMYGQCRLF